MQVSFAGKGGSGKTTISATVARTLARKGYTVRAIDGDSNPNMAIALGIPAHDAIELAVLPKEIARRDVDPEGKRVTVLLKEPSDLFEEFGVDAPDGIRLLLGSRVGHAGSGWSCSSHATVRGIIGELKAAEGITVIDMEAGLELFGRGTPGASDLLTIVIEPSLWSIQTATRIIDLARELGIPKLIAVANKIREEADVEWIREALRPQGVEVVGVVPYDTDVSLADRRMSSLLDVALRSAAACAIAELAGVIAREVGAAPPAAEASANGAGGNGKAGDDGCPWVVDAYK